MLLPVLLAAIVNISSPAGPNASAPHLTTAKDGSLAMSWYEGKSLKMATYRNNKWSASTIATRDDFWINWADFASITQDRRGTWFAHWPQRNGSGTYSYDVMVTSSVDGKKWKTPRKLNGDNTKTEHGFVSMVALDEGGVGIVWLDGREMEKNGPMALRYAVLDASLNVRDEKVLDPRVCECCTTSITKTNSTVVVAYRDRTEDEIRDISFLNLGTGKPVASVHNDGWKTPGCPVNGPQLDGYANTVAAAWFTAANEEPRVLASLSRGRVKFNEPLRIDTKNAVGRVDVIAIDQNSAMVSWIEGGANDAGIYVRTFRTDGRIDAPVRVAATSSARGSGFPRMARSGQYVYIAWTDPTAKTIKVARIDL